MGYAARRLRPAEAIYQPEPVVEQLPPATVWLNEDPRPLRDVEDVLKYHLRLQLQRGTWEAWVKDLRLVALEGGTARIMAANALAEDWLAKRLRPMLERTLRTIAGEEITVIIEGPR